MELLVPLPVVVPLAAAAVIAGFGRFVRSRLVDTTAILVAAGITAVTAWLLTANLQDTLTYWYGGWAPVGGLAIGIAFVVQPFGAALALLASVVTVITLVFPTGTSRKSAPCSTCWSWSSSPPCAGSP